MPRSRAEGHRNKWNRPSLRIRAECPCGTWVVRRVPDDEWSAAQARWFVLAYAKHVRRQSRGTLSAHNGRCLSCDFRPVGIVLQADFSSKPKASDRGYVTAPEDKGGGSLRLVRLACEGVLKLHELGTPLVLEGEDPWSERSSKSDARAASCSTSPSNGGAA